MRVMKAVVQVGIGLGASLQLMEENGKEVDDWLKEAVAQVPDEPPPDAFGGGQGFGSGGFGGGGGFRNQSSSGFGSGGGFGGTDNDGGGEGISLL